jgi:hypothetical protein
MDYFSCAIINHCYQEYQRRNNWLLSNSEDISRRKAELNLINSNNLLDESG